MTSAEERIKALFASMFCKFFLSFCVTVLVLFSDELFLRLVCVADFSLLSLIAFPSQASELPLIRKAIFYVHLLRISQQEQQVENGNE